nr:MAG: capsid protein [Astroviridae sp.]
MEQRKPRGRSRSRSRGGNSGESVVKTVTVVEDNGAKPKRGRSRSRSKSRGRRRGILKQSANPVSAAIATNIQRRKRSRSRGRNKNKSNKGGQAHLQREITALKRKTNGPKVSDTFKLTVTVGVVSGNTADDFGIQRSLSLLLHPVLLRDATANNASTPLSDRAKNYALWRCTGCHVRFMPFVNDSHVTGTLIFGSVDLDAQAAKPLSIDAILARPYCEMSLGGRGQWSIPQKTLRGPEEGWWKVDTNDTATNAVGPGIDIHTYGTTYNLLSVPTATTTPPTIGTQNLPKYTGPLCSVQVTLSFEFANWEPKPALGTLVSETISSEGVTLSTDDEQNIVLTPDVTPGWLSFNEMSQAVECHIHPHYHFPGLKAVAPSRGLGSTIWAITDTVADVASTVLPGPWGWLFKNGYSFLRRIFGTSGSNPTGPSYKVYASMEDAQRDVGCTNDVPLSSAVRLQMGEVRLAQMNNTNVQTAINFAPTGYVPPTPPGPTPVACGYPLSRNANNTIAPWDPAPESNVWYQDVSATIAYSAFTQRFLTAPSSATPFLNVNVIVFNPIAGKNQAISFSGLSDPAQRRTFPASLPRPVFDVIRIEEFKNQNATASFNCLASTYSLQFGTKGNAHPQPAGTVHSLMQWAFTNPVGGRYPPFMQLNRTLSETKNRALWGMAQNNTGRMEFLNEADILAPFGWQPDEDLYMLPGFIHAAWQPVNGTHNSGLQPACLLISKTAFDKVGDSGFIIISSDYPILRWQQTTYAISLSYPVNTVNSVEQVSQDKPYEQVYGEGPHRYFYLSTNFLTDTLPVPPLPPVSDEYPPEAAGGVNPRYVAELEWRLARAERALGACKSPTRPSTPLSDDGSCSFEPVECPETGIREFASNPSQEDCCASLDEETLERFRKLFVKSKK